MKRLSVAMAAALTMAVPAPALAADFSGKAAEPAMLYRSAATDEEMRVIVEFVPTGRAGGEVTPASVESATNGILRDVFGATRARSGEGWQASPMQFSPMFSFVGSAADVEALSAHGAVAKVYPDRQSSLQLSKSVPKIGATSAVMSPYTGTNTIVAVIDSGVMKNHVFINGSVVSEACYSDSNRSGVNSLCPGKVGSSTKVGSGVNCPMSFQPQQCDHGTHVAGIITGKRSSGTPSRGVAPNTGIIAIMAGTALVNQSGNNVTFFDSDLVRSLERVYALRAAFPGKQVVAVNMSLGGGRSYDACDARSPLTSIINKLRTARIATVIASGNNGDRLGVAFPACISSAITVGSTTVADGISSFSNRGPLIDVFAPGSDIVSSQSNSTTTFQSKSGTSMAAPHVAGAWALLRQAYPTATVTRLEAALEGKGVTITDPETLVRKPRIALSPTKPAVPLGFLHETNDTPIAILGPSGSTTFAAQTGLTRTLQSSSGTVGFRTTESLSWLGLGTGTASGSVSTAASKTLRFTINQTAAKSLPDGIFTGRVVVTNTTRTQVARDIEATIASYVPASRNNANSAARSITRVQHYGSNKGATLQTGEPNNYFDQLFGQTFFKNTVWWRKTWPTSGVKTITTIGSSIDTVVCVYRGAGFNNPIGCNDYFDPNNGGPSGFQMQVQAGVSYYFQIGSWAPNASANPPTGFYVLNVSQ